MATKSGEIIRATSTGGRDQVVMLYGVLGNGGTIRCSGSYYAPRVVVTAAQLPGRPPTPPEEIRAKMRANPRPWLILFGTGHGLVADVLAQADYALPPIRPGVYNHLSVRAACAITLDRLFGDEGAAV